MPEVFTPKATEVKCQRYLHAALNAMGIYTKGNGGEMPEVFTPHSMGYLPRVQKRWKSTRGIYTRCNGGIYTTFNEVKCQRYLHWIQWGIYTEGAKSTRGIYTGFNGGKTRIPPGVVGMDAGHENR